MEVHHHSHHAPGETHRRKWVDHLWEFIMLFLAVTLGFFVENQREHIIEHRREKIYIHSIREDIRQDIYQLDSIIRMRAQMDKLMDSLLYLLNYTDPKLHGTEIYFYTRWIPRAFRFFGNDRTISQLKNAGNWRLIRNQEVSAGLAAYNTFANIVTTFIEQREESLILILYQSIDKLFDNRVFEKMVKGMGFIRPEGNPQLVSYDKNDINEFCNRVHFRKNANFYFISNAEKLLGEAKKTLALIEKEYHLN